MHGGVLNKELNEQLRNILDKLASNSNLLDDGNNIEGIRLFLAKGADPNVKNQDGKTLSYYLNEKLSDILNKLASNRALLDNSNNIQYITSLLGIGADPNIQNQNGKTLSDYLNKKLSDILESNRDPLNNIQHITLLLEAGADPNVKNQDGKTLSYYSSKRLHDVLNEANNSDLLGNHGYIQHIMFLLQAGANPNLQNQDGKTLLHYVAERNDTDGIKILLKKGASLKIRDHSGKTPFEYVTEHECRQAIKDLVYDLDDSHENEGNPATPDGSVGDCSNNSSDCNTEEDLNCSSSDNLCNDDKNDNEKDDKETVTNLILEEIEGVVNDRVKPRDGTKEYIGRVNDITDQDDEDKDEALDITESITSNLLLEGGKAKEEFFSSGSDTELAQNYRSDYIRNPGEKCKEIKDKLESIAYEGIVSRDRQAQNGKLEAVEIDNQCFRMKYSQDSIIEPAKILNHEKAKELNLKVGTIQIGKSIVKVESVGKKRNYTDILKGSIEMSFTTEVGEISIYLSPSKKDGNKIKVEIDEENKAKFNKLKDKSSLGENCLLEGESVAEVIGKDFKMSDSVSTETTKDVPFTNLTQVHLQQNREVALVS